MPRINPVNPDLRSTGTRLPDVVCDVACLVGNGAHRVGGSVRRHSGALSERDQKERRRKASLDPGVVVERTPQIPGATEEYQRQGQQGDPVSKSLADRTAPANEIGCG